jgi:hypothetical protein
MTWLVLFVAHKQQLNFWAIAAQFGIFICIKRV